MSRARWWAAGILVLIVAIALLWWGDRDDQSPVKAPIVEFPTHLRPDEVQRAHRRHTARASVAKPPDTSAVKAGPPRDSLLSALPEAGDKPAVVIEFNALRHSIFGERLIACLGLSEGKGLEEIERQIGINPLQDIDRLAFVGGSAYVSGFLGQLKLPGQPQMQAIGTDGRITPVDSNSAFGTWSDQLAIFGPQAEVSGALTRVQSGTSSAPSWLPEASTYGDVYGTLPAEALARILPPEQQALANQLKAVAQQISFHVDAQNDVAATFDVGGSDAAGLADLSKSISGLLQLARIAISRDKDPEVADLLDQAKVVPGANGDFSVQVVLPQARVDQLLEQCAARDGG